MNLATETDGTQIELMKVVERAVRPVIASSPRKYAMREELLAHVMAVFEEERHKLADEQAALARTRQRFGDPRAVTAELQGTVSRSDRVTLFVERLFWSPKDTPRDTVRKLVLNVLIMFIAMVAMMLTAALLKRDKLSVTLPLMLEIALVMPVVVPVSSYVGVVLASGVRRELFDSERPSRSRAASIGRAAGYLLGSALFLPLLAFLMYWGLSGDLPGALNHLRFACYFAPFVPLVMFLATRQWADEYEQLRQWERLELES